jgi:hypothetical protein
MHEKEIESLKETIDDHKNEIQNMLSSKTFQLESNENEIINLKDQINRKVCIYLNRPKISKYIKIIF